MQTIIIITLSAICLYLVWSYLKLQSITDEMKTQLEAVESVYDTGTCEICGLYGHLEDDRCISCNSVLVHNFTEDFKNFLKDTFTETGKDNFNDWLDNIEEDYLIILYKNYLTKNYE